MNMQPRWPRSRWLHLRWAKRSVRWAIAGFLALAIGFVALPLMAPAMSPQAKVFNQAWQTIQENFFDTTFNGANWSALKDQYLPKAEQAKSTSELSSVINTMIGELKTSHTRFLTPEEPAYYQILGIFQTRSRELKNLPKTIFPTNKLEYTDIGVITQTINGKLFIKNILEGSPAEQAKLLVGDEILSVDGQPFHPIQSFAGKAGKSVRVLVQRSPDSSSRLELTATPKVFLPATMFLDAQKASTRIISRDGKKLGYVHMWSYANDQFQTQLENDLFYGKLREADGLILDLRDGWGGSPMSVLNIFTGKGPTLTSIGRDRKSSISRTHWQNPVVMIVNEGSRSAKEILAYGFQAYDIGKVVGSKTAGAVVAGRPFLMQDGSLLYVAVADVYVDGNQRLEGRGVEPDVVVPFPVNYAQGADPQQEAAIATLLQELNPTNQQNQGANQGSTQS